LEDIPSPSHDNSHAVELYVLIFICEPGKVWNMLHQVMQMQQHHTLC